MKLLATIRSLLAPATDDCPLVVLGPGGDFTEHVVARDGALVTVSPVCHSLQESDLRLRTRRHRLSRFLASQADPVTDRPITRNHH